MLNYQRVWKIRHPTFRVAQRFAKLSTLRPKIFCFSAPRAKMDTRGRASCSHEGWLSILELPSINNPQDDHKRLPSGELT